MGKKRENRELRARIVELERVNRDLTDRLFLSLGHTPLQSNAVLASVTTEEAAHVALPPQRTTFAQVKGEAEKAAREGKLGLHSIKASTPVIATSNVAEGTHG